MKERIVVSVIVPVYQVEKYIRRCINSIRAQTYKNLQVLLIDDGTRDDSGKICDEYAKKDHRIEVFHKENGGLSDARNYGLEHAVGEYIVFVDSDDFLCPQYVERLLEMCVTEEADIAICDYSRTEHDYIILQHKKFKTKEYSGIKAVEQLFGRNHVYMTVAWNKMYKRELFEGIRFPKGKIHEDEATTYKLFLKSTRVIATDEILYGYFMSEGSIMRDEYRVQRLDIIKIALDRLKTLQKAGYSDLVLLSKRELSNILIYHYYQCRNKIKGSGMIQEKLFLLHEKYCVKDAQAKQFPVLARINCLFFNRNKELYCILFGIYQWFKILIL